MIDDHFADKNMMVDSDDFLGQHPLDGSAVALQNTSFPH